MSALEVSHELTAPPVAPQRPDRALQGLYERHADRIFGFCRNRLRSHQEAEDAVQTTFLHALRALQRGVVPLSETAWLFKIAENVCLSAHRTNGRRGDQEVFDGEELVARAPAREDRSDSLFGLENALAAIPERQRRVFVLRELRGLSYREIALEQGVTVAAVETLVFRARRSLARALENGAGLRGRVASVFDLGAFVGVIKTAFGGATAAKVLAAAAVVAVATVPAGDSVAPTGANVHAKRQIEEREPNLIQSGSPSSSRPGRPLVVRAGAPAPERSKALTAAGPAKAGTARKALKPSAPSQSRQTADPTEQAQAAPASPAPSPVIREPELPIAVPEAVAPLPVQVPPPPVSLPAPPELPKLPVELPKLSDELPELPAVP